MKVSFADTKPKIECTKKANAGRRQSVAIPSIKVDKCIAETSEDDNYDLWDHNRGLGHNEASNWRPRVCWKPSCIPISIICVLIVIVLLLPISQYKEKLLARRHSNLAPNKCTSSCNIQLVESIPEGLEFPDGPKFMSTFDAWNELLDLATTSINIGSFYWTLRGADFYNHTSAWQGEKIFENILNTGLKRNVKIRIAQSAPSKKSPNIDTEILVKRKAAEVRSVNFPRLLGGGVLHTKLWIVDDKHMYVGSANMDWRSLTQVKELGVLITNCSCLVNDVSKIFNVYWDMGKEKSVVPPSWPKEYSTRINSSNPMPVAFNDQYQFNTYFSSSPPPFSPKGRTQDVDAIVNVINNAEKFVHIAVMDYFPLLIYTPKPKYWPIIDDALRAAAINNRVSVKLLISYWNHSRSAEDYFLRSLQDLSNAYHGVDLQIKRFICTATDDQAKIPFGRVNHNKYMVTDKVAYIGTSNWSGDYFVNTAGIGLVLEDPLNDRNESSNTIRNDLARLFERDWNSPYARDLIKNV